MSACTKHTKEPVKGYHACVGCEVESLRIERDTLRHGYRIASDRVVQYEEVIQAARKLVKAKGRYHTEQNYKALADALAGIDAPAPSSQ
jgi:hypothetical protein